MRVRFLSVSYQFGGASGSPQRYFQEVREAMLTGGHSYTYLRPNAYWRPPMDIHETPDALLVKIEVAGLREDDIEVSLYPNALVVSGMREDDADHDEGDCFHEAQVRYGPFRADVALPTPVDPDRVSAVYRDGFLRVRLPKATPGERKDVEQSLHGAEARGGVSGKLLRVVVSPAQP